MRNSASRLSIASPDAVSACCTSMIRHKVYMKRLYGCRGLSFHKKFLEVNFRNTVRYPVRWHLFYVISHLGIVPGSSLICNTALEKCSPQVGPRKNGSTQVSALKVSVAQVCTHEVSITQVSAFKMSTLKL